MNEMKCEYKTKLVYNRILISKGLLFKKLFQPEIFSNKSVL